MTRADWIALMGHGNKEILDYAFFGKRARPAVK